MHMSVSQKVEMWFPPARYFLYILDTVVKYMIIE